MADFFTDNGVATDELFAPGCVRFDCKIWGLPDNTTGKTGWHVVYRPLAEGFGYKGHDLVTPAMREAVRAHYQARNNAEAAAERAATDALRAADDLLSAIPMAAQTELAAKQRTTARHFAVLNEGGEGYVPEVSWRTKEGREIAARHGLDIDAIVRALNVVEG
jgi:hypothetical protein